MSGTTVSCCGLSHPIIQWTDVGDRQYGAECSVCGKRVSGETPSDVVEGFSVGEMQQTREVVT
jgi:hypothetical protein